MGAPLKPGDSVDHKSVSKLLDPVEIPCRGLMPSIKIHEVLKIGTIYSDPRSQSESTAVAAQ